jgi:hypothetical protein
MEEGRDGVVTTVTSAPPCRSSAGLGVASPAFVSTEDGSMSEPASFPRLRPSVSHQASRQAEIARLRRMTVEERVKEALGLASRFAAMQPAPRKD